MVGVLNPIPYKSIFRVNDRVIQAGDPSRQLKPHFCDKSTHKSKATQASQVNTKESIDTMENQPVDSDDQPVSPRSLIRNPPRVPQAAEEFYRYEWTRIPSSVRAAMDNLKARTGAVFHDSSYYYAVCYGVEHQLDELSRTVRAIQPLSCQPTQSGVDRL